MAETTAHTKYLDPVALARLKNLGLAARLVVDGLYTGQHRSPRKGFSVEFAEHRQYTPGVDPRHLDWKILAKRDRLYVKQYEEQTNLRATIVLDASASMRYQHGAGLSKFEYARFCAATLAYLMMSQHDAFGLVVCGADETGVPPRQGRAHLNQVLGKLEEAEAAGETGLAGSLHRLAGTMKRRGLVILLSDLLGVELDEDGRPAVLMDALAHFRHRKHELVVMQVLDPSELRFPFRDAGQIEDMETGRAIEADAEAIRDHYLERIAAYIEGVRRDCQRRDIGYALAETSEPVELFLGTYLTRRQHLHAAKS